MKDWRDIQIEHISKIEKIVAVFQVWSITKFPSAKILIKVVEFPEGDYYIGVPNIAAKDRNGSPDWMSGGGRSVALALEDTIKNVLQSIEENGASSEEDFEWSAPEDF